MKERKQITYLQRFAWLGSLCLLAVLFMLGSCVEVKAGKKNETCKLQSVTLEINGEQQTYSGEVSVVAVDAEADWEEFFRSVKIVDYQVVENDLCNHEDGHDSITAYAPLFDEDEKIEGWQLVSKYRNDLNEYFQLEDDFEDESYCALYFCLDGNKDNCIKVYFAKKYKITYDTQGGTFMDGQEGPDSYLCVDDDSLPPVEKDGYIFKGWYLEGESEDTAEICFYVDELEEPGDIKVIASFEEGERQDISNFTFTGELADETSEFTYRGFEVTPDFYVYSPEQDELYRGWDYICEFENNIEPASADDTNPPTVIVRGIGEYTGTLKKTFTIQKATPAILRRYADILEGEPLSSIDSTLLARIYGTGNKNISGTIEWEKGNDYVLTGEAGVSENCSMSFIPEDPVHYETVTGIPVSISVKKDIQSWNVELEQQNYPYTGVPIEPKVTVKDGDTELRYNYDYYVGYSNNVNCNGETTSPTVTIVASGTNNYTGTREVTFTIEKATPQCETMPVCTAITEGQTLADSTFSGGGVTGVIKGKEVAGNFVWKDPEITPSLSDSDKTKYTAVFKPISANYNEIEIELSVSVKAKPAVPTTPPTVPPTPMATQTVTPTVPPTTPPTPAVTPTATPTVAPTATPTATPTETPAVPTATPTVIPTAIPTVAPTAVPTVIPTVVPTTMPTVAPTAVPTVSPTAVPTVIPTTVPTPPSTTAPSTAVPTVVPTDVPNVMPTTEPTLNPTAVPTDVPTTPQVTVKPSANPSEDDEDDLQVGDKVQDAKKKAYYIVKTMDGDDIEVFYAAPASKTKAVSITISNTVVLENGQKAKVTGIEKNAFSGCKKLKKVVIGKNVTTIRANAFKKCKKLKTIIVKSKKLQKLDKAAFKGVFSKTVIKVPADQYKKYKKLFRKSGLKKSVKIKKQ